MFVEVIRWRGVHTTTATTVDASLFYFLRACFLVALRREVPEVRHAVDKHRQAVRSQGLSSTHTHTQKKSIEFRECMYTEFSLATVRDLTKEFANCGNDATY